ncbi:hypothetical protein D8B26_006733 [Coccidioides posadasii str. Silveira]|uniref:Uncharacterized protein n=1 Tax=Coccidioides posadasii (strain RMSCC 757 / Silveira) TaxID=443226 RepID=E9CR97_COCPS|nr:conserved hypothetical protein [Coccidioides posadasii str. Silveira]QVM12097.1 hypothetical protein D8B26_006733 [Coccidioides posadasii str. Silveira]
MQQAQSTDNCYTDERQRLSRAWAARQRLAMRQKMREMRSMTGQEGHPLEHETMKCSSCGIQIKDDVTPSATACRVSLAPDQVILMMNPDSEASSAPGSISTDSRSSGGASPIAVYPGISLGRSGTIIVVSTSSGASGGDRAAAFTTALHKLDAAAPAVVKALDGLN